MKKEYGTGTGKKSNLINYDYRIKLKDSYAAQELVDDLDDLSYNDKVNQTIKDVVDNKIANIKITGDKPSVAANGTKTKKRINKSMKNINMKTMFHKIAVFKLKKLTLNEKKCIKNV